MKSKLINRIALIFTMSIGIPAISVAQVVSLDPTFGTNGKVYTDFDSTGIGGGGRAFAIQSDGKIVVVGGASNYDIWPINHDIALVRYNTDGSLDNTFGNNGKVTTDFSNTELGLDVAIQSDGKIVIVGSLNDDIAVFRYNSNGSVDYTFGISGKVITNIAIDFLGQYTSEIAYFGAILSDGKILVVGTVYKDGLWQFAMIRYNTNGSLDNTFGNSGIVTTSADGLFQWARYAAIQNDDKIIAIGYRNYGNGNSVFTLVRYNSDGSIDNSFGSDGTVTTDINAFYDHAFSVAIQSDGKIVAGGFSDNGNEIDSDFALVRYNANGSVDNTFGNNGIVTTAFGPNDDFLNSLAVQSDGKIIAAGMTSIDGQNQFVLVRYTINGSLDDTFGIDGKIISHAGIAFSVAIQNDGKIVAAGVGIIDSRAHFVVVRYNNNIISGIGASVNRKTEINIYPNPFSTRTVLKTEKFFENATLNIYNSKGQTVKELKNINGQTITIYRDNLPSGFYLLHLTENNVTYQLDNLVISD